MGKYALLIGVETYGEGLQPLPAASKDVAALREVLLNPKMGEFDEVKPLVNPTQPEMAREIELWFQDRQPDDLVLLFFSGHGVKDDRRDLYFAAANTEKQRDRLLTSTATSARFIHDRIRACKAKYQVLILDCCFSGAFGEFVARDDGEIPLKEQLEAEGRVVLTSTSAVDYSFEEKGADLSIYTRYLVEGIATGAADEDGDGVITAEELHRYAGRKVEEASPAMSPKIFIPQGEGYRIRLARSPQDDPRLKYRKEVERRATAAEFTIPAKRLLVRLRTELGISEVESEAIEAEVLKPHRDYQRKRQEYQETLHQCLERESPLSPRTINDLRDYRAHLRLKPEDVTAIEQAALNGPDLEGYAANLERQQQEQVQQQAQAQRQQQERTEAERQAQEQKATEQRQREAAEQLRQIYEAELLHQQQEAERHQQEKAATTQRPSQPIGIRQPPQPIASPPSHARPPASSTTLSRQQFLKWGGLSGLGLIGAFGISQALKNAPLTEVDYTRLEELLAAKQWKDADQETFNVMLKITNREAEGYLDSESLWNFPCGALAKIDQLWVEASDGKFGFSVQKKIYVDNCGGQPDGQYDKNAWNCFADKVGWRVNGTWLNYSQVIFDTTAPSGHLPAGGGFWVGLWGLDVRWVDSFSCRDL
ncbi:MAG: GUN4 domain-containing protein [Tildeniella torsiva UHER 1998/13D]|jgi:flagellar biosynthesis GTPase FlhF|nr:GUN4 domain-containing protein [Tildeniella torsiva UHER 1998/13D]